MPVLQDQGDLFPPHRVALPFTVEEKTNVIALQGHITGLGFADNAFLDNSLGPRFYPWCEEQGYDMSLV
jgi:hypothetical protein